MDPHCQFIYHAFGEVGFELETIEKSEEAVLKRLFLILEGKNFDSEGAFAFCEVERLSWEETTPSGSS